MFRKAFLFLLNSLITAAFGNMLCNSNQFLLIKGSINTIKVDTSCQKLKFPLTRKSSTCLNNPEYVCTTISISYFNPMPWNCSLKGNVFDSCTKNEKNTSKIRTGEVDCTYKGDDVSARTSASVLCSFEYSVKNCDTLYWSAWSSVSSCSSSGERKFERSCFVCDKKLTDDKCRKGRSKKSESCRSATSDYVRNIAIISGAFFVVIVMIVIVTLVHRRKLQRKLQNMKRLMNGHEIDGRNETRSQTSVAHRSSHEVDEDGYIVPTSKHQYHEIVVQPPIIRAITLPGFVDGKPGPLTIHQVQAKRRTPSKFSFCRTFL